MDLPPRRLLLHGHVPVLDHSSAPGHHQRSTISREPGCLDEVVLRADRSSLAAGRDIREPDAVPCAPRRQAWVSSGEKARHWTAQEWPGRLRRARPDPSSRSQIRTRPSAYPAAGRVHRGRSGGHRPAGHDRSGSPGLLRRRNPRGERSHRDPPSPGWFRPVRTPNIGPGRRKLAAWIASRPWPRARGSGWSHHRRRPGSHRRVRRPGRAPSLRERRRVPSSRLGPPPRGPSAIGSPGGQPPAIRGEGHGTNRVPGSR